MQRRSLRFTALVPKCLLEQVISMWQRSCQKGIVLQHLHWTSFLGTSFSCKSLIFYIFFSLVWWKYLLVSHSPFKYADQVINLICILIVLSQGINCLPIAITPPNFCRAILGLWQGWLQTVQYLNFWTISEFWISWHLPFHVLKCFSVIIGSMR